MNVSRFHSPFILMFTISSDFFLILFRSSRTTKSNFSLSCKFESIFCKYSEMELSVSKRSLADPGKSRQGRRRVCGSCTFVQVYVWMVVCLYAFPSLPGWEWKPLRAIQSLPAPLGHGGYHGIEQAARRG
jgi:hypothetical protein